MGDAGERVSGYLYPKEQSRSRARTTGEQRSREERIKRRKPKEKSFTLSSPISPPYYHRVAFFKLSPAVYRNPSPHPPAPVLVRCCLFSQNGSVQGNKGCFEVSQIWSQSSGFKRSFHRRHLSSSSSVRLSYVRSLRVQPGEKFFLHCLNEFIPKLFCPRTNNDQVYQLQSYVSN